MRFDCIPPEFSPFRNFKKSIGKLNSLTVRKKKKKKSRPTDPIFKFWSGEGNITFFFFGPDEDTNPDYMQKIVRHYTFGKNYSDNGYSRYGYSRYILSITEHLLISYSKWLLIKKTNYM